MNELSLECRFLSMLEKHIHLRSHFLLITGSIQWNNY